MSSYYYYIFCAYAIWLLNHSLFLNRTKQKYHRSVFSNRADTSHGQHRPETSRGIISDKCRRRSGRRRLLRGGWLTDGGRGFTPAEWRYSRRRKRVLPVGSVLGCRQRYRHSAGRRRSVTNSDFAATNVILEITSHKVRHSKKWIFRLNDVLSLIIISGKTIHSLRN